MSCLGPLLIGATVRKESRILGIDHKLGRAGDRVFVTVLHELKSLAGDLLVRKEHDIVYQEAAPRPRSAQQALHPDIDHAVPRYSALIFNGNRTHCDQDYCRNVEGYAHLVIRGPLTATMLS